MSVPVWAGPEREYRREWPTRSTARQRAARSVGPDALEHQSPGRDRQDKLGPGDRKHPDTVAEAVAKRTGHGTTHLRFDPFELLERLAALTPRPRVNLILYYGVLAPRAAWRLALVPSAPGGTIAGPRVSLGGVDAAHVRRGRRRNGPNAPYRRTARWRVELILPADCRRDSGFVGAAL